MIGEICLYLRSLPVWECGLKSDTLDCAFQAHMSLPARECGLKCTRLYILINFYVSLPAWECGLLHEYYNKNSIEL